MAKRNKPTHTIDAQDKWYDKFVKQPTTKDAHSQRNSQKSTNKHTSNPQKWTTFPQGAPVTHPHFSTATTPIINHSSLFDVKAIPQDALHILNTFDVIIQQVQPLNSKQLAHLGSDIRDLSHELTDTRSQRRVGYMNETIRLSAYIRYFMWWNLVRLVRLFSHIPTEQLLPADALSAEEIICLDIGCGPLTVPIALWLSHPELRNKPLVWYCMDVSQTAASIGEELYLSIAARTLSQETDSPWKIIRVKGAMGTPIRKKAQLVTCANMMNEMQQHSDMPPEYQAKKYSTSLRSYSDTNGHIFIVEPGVPDYAHMISLIRDCFIRDNMDSLSPCPHMGICPMSGRTFKNKNAKWCNFAFTTDDAPEKLKSLSATAGLPKERAVLSYLLVAPKKTVTENKHLQIRIASDPIRLPGNRTGFYACSEIGLVLVIEGHNTRRLASGDSVTIESPVVKKLHTDAKTGAYEITL